MSPLDVVQLALNVGGCRPMLIDVTRHIQRSSFGLPAERDGESSTAWIDPDLKLNPARLIRSLWWRFVYSSPCVLLSGRFAAESPRVVYPGVRPPGLKQNHRAAIQQTQRIRADRRDRLSLRLAWG